ncbi:MAG TPA: AfsR/SARP family transcriptional regulator, partial [Jiangellaceae bacterium]|nr:AfsR/SARP family transcriptional regulator [Jiangellaceae bacterium]
MSMRIGMLGPLEVRAESGEQLELSGARLRALLIRLALEPGRVVTHAQLVDALWADDPPSGAANALQALVSRLRRALPDGVVESHPSGYRLAVRPSAVDLHRFEQLLTRARAAAATDRPDAEAALAEALRLWRGPALADVADAEFARGTVSRLTELRLRTVEDLVEAQLQYHGERPDVTALEALVGDHPTRERAVGLLMRALVANGRSADALAAYEQLRTTLADQFGTDPGP